MRVLLLSVSVLCAACLGATCAIAQTTQTGQWGQAEDQIPPYQTHADRRHGHDREYPDRGAVVRDLPQGAATVNYAGISYRFAAGVWYQRLGPAYIVVAPPIGVIVPQLPAFATSFDRAGKTYLYANDVFYRPRPDLGGYEVVNDPEDVVPERSQAPAVVSPSRVASAAPSAPPTPPKSPAQPKNMAESSPTPAAGSPSVSSVPANASAPENPPAPESSSTAESPSAPGNPPPPESSSAAESTPVPGNASALGNPTAVAITPRNGQSADQEAMDRYQCYRFAVAQTGFDPLASNHGTAPGNLARGDSEYSRAQAACLEERGYTVP